MRILSTLLLHLLISVPIQSQETLKLDSIDMVVEITVNNDIVYTHRLEEKETLYSLSRFFRTPVQDLMQVNNIKTGKTISIGQEIKVPINNQIIDMSVDNPGKEWIPVVYIVKRRETLFKISHVYFPQAIQELINRNNISSFSLKEGQKLIVGWWPIQNTDNEQEKEDISKEDILTKLISDLESLIDLEKPVKQDSIQSSVTDSIPLIAVKNDSLMHLDSIAFTSSKGIAFWNKEGSDFENLFVMHNNARENSYIKLRNPVNGKVVVAKVIMPIPEQIYTEDIDIVITPAVAKNLGALDSRFRIEMDYYE
ncbi:MAG: LysM peptidoglycan-binding domain-containing protein [Saprospiraceae bacterium]|nr:LysM peptidoglycan-binding domain-containing protein [Saprospiraceae bacterium]